MARTRVGYVDNAWLRMEDPTNLMMITGVMIFGTPMNFERLQATIEQRLLRFDRFRQRVVSSRLPPHRVFWEDDPHFDLKNHIRRITLTPPGDREALQDVAGALMSTQLDFSKPLWEVHVVERYRDGCALIVRLHHAIADGIALVRVLLSLTDADPDAPWPVSPPKEARRQVINPLARICRPARAALQTTTQITETLLHQSGETLRHPSRALDLALFGARSASALGRLVLRWPDPRTPFKGDLGIAKRAAWSDPIPLADVKAVGRGMGGTVNDVLLTAVTGALRRYIEGRGEPVDNVDFRAVVPVNLRPMDEELVLGNRFGLVFLALPVGIADPMDRLFELKRRMDALKDTPEPVVVLGILNVMGMAPKAVQDIGVKIFASKGTTVMTNVPGPRETIYLAGAPLDSIMFWVPQSGRLGLGVSIISYAGQVLVGVATDRGLVPDPEAIVTHFQIEFDALFELSKELERIPAEETPDKAISEIPSESIGEMISIVRDAIQKVDALIQQASEGPDVEAVPIETAPAPRSTPQQHPERCQALTKAGAQCKNRALSGSIYCRVHQAGPAREAK